MCVCWPHFSIPHQILFPHELCIYYKCPNKGMFQALKVLITSSFLPCMETLIHAFHQIQVFSPSQLATAIVCDDREADKDVL